MYKTYLVTKAPQTQHECECWYQCKRCVPLSGERESECVSSLGASPTVNPSRLHGTFRHLVQLPMELLPAVLREIAKAEPVVHLAAAQ